MNQNPLSLNHPEDRDENHTCIDLSHFAIASATSVIIKFLVSVGTIWIDCQSHYCSWCSCFHQSLYWAGNESHNTW